MTSTERKVEIARLQQEERDEQHARREAARQEERRKNAEHDANVEAYFDENNIPIEFRVPIATLAWDEGHAYGFGEVMDHVRDHVDHLGPAIVAYTKRLLTSSVN